VSPVDFDCKATPENQVVYNNFFLFLKKRKSGTAGGGLLKNAKGARDIYRWPLTLQLFVDWMGAIAGRAEHFI